MANYCINYIDPTGLRVARQLQVKAYVKHMTRTSNDHLSYVALIFNFKTQKLKCISGENWNNIRCDSTNFRSEFMIMIWSGNFSFQLNIKFIEYLKLDIICHDNVII